MTLEDALTTAIAHETEVQHHYARGAGEILDAKGKHVFATLAKEELGHLAYLESRLDEWHRTGRVSAPQLATVVPSQGWIAAARARAAEAPEPTIAVKGEMELLKVALDLEHRTSAFYRRLVETLAVGERELFARFLEIEEGHLAVVQAEIDALAGHGSWFDVMEFRLEAG
jgi:rubrerythrin